MPQTLSNGVIVPINPDAYQECADLATMGNSIKQNVPVMSKKTLGSASGTLAVALSWIANGGAITVPAAPFGTGVQYDIEFTAQCAPTITTGTNGGAAFRVQIDGTTCAQSQVTSPGGQTLAVTSSLTITDNIAHTVTPQVSALNQTVSLSSGANISYLQVTLVPSVSF